MSPIKLKSRPVRPQNKVKYLYSSEVTERNWTLKIRVENKCRNVVYERFFLAGGRAVATKTKAPIMRSFWQGVKLAQFWPILEDQFQLFWRRVRAPNKPFSSPLRCTWERWWILENELRWGRIGRMDLGNLIILVLIGAVFGRILSSLFLSSKLTTP